MSLSDDLNKKYDPPDPKKEQEKILATLKASMEAVAHKQKSLKIPKHKSWSTLNVLEVFKQLNSEGVKTKLSNESQRTWIMKKILGKRKQTYIILEW